MKEIEIQIARLKRHFDACCSEYDPISLLDLAHSLRLIGESREEIVKKYPIENKNSLKCCVQTKKIKSLVKVKPFVMALFPRMVKTENMTFGTFLLLLRKMTDDEISSSSVILKSNPTVVYDIGTWFQSEAVAWRDIDGGPRRSLSKERIIKRVANYLGGSHPMGNSLGTESDDDRTLMYFMNFKVAERPLPYLILMSIAQELLLFVGAIKN